MSSDQAYSAFLEQANQETDSSKDSNIVNTVSTKSVNTEVPIQLQNIEQYYTSEVDEPFEPVSLRWDGSELPSESENPHFTFYLGLYDNSLPSNVAFCIR